MARKTTLKEPKDIAHEVACNGHLDAIRRQIQQLEELVEHHEKAPKSWALSGTLYEFRKQLGDAISFATPVGK